MAEEFENINEQAEAVEAEVKEAQAEVNAEAQEAEAKAESFKEKAEDFKENFKDKAEDFKEKAEEKAEAAKAKAEEAFEKVKADMDDVTDEMDPDDIKKNKVFAVLSYFSILVLIPIFCAKNSKFARFHANQGLVLFLADLIVGILAGILFKPWVTGVFNLIFLVLAIMGIIYACQGKAKELPVLGNIKLLK